MCKKTENWTLCADIAAVKFLETIAEKKGLSKSKAIEFCVSHTQQTMNDDTRIARYTDAIRADIKAFHDEFSELKIDLDKALE